MLMKMSIRSGNKVIFYMIINGNHEMSNSEEYGWESANVTHLWFGRGNLEENFIFDSSLYFLWLLMVNSYCQYGSNVLRSI